METGWRLLSKTPEAFLGNVPRLRHEARRAGYRVVLGTEAMLLA
jgi:hypothetical protein